MRYFLSDGKLYIMPEQRGEVTQLQTEDDAALVYWLVTRLSAGVNCFRVYANRFRGRFATYREIDQYAAKQHADFAALVAFAKHLAVAA